MSDVIHAYMPGGTACGKVCNPAPYTTVQRSGVPSQITCEACRRSPSMPAEVNDDGTIR